MGGVKFAGGYGLPVGRVRPGMVDGAEPDKTRPKPDAFKNVLDGKGAEKGAFGLL